MIFLMGLSMVQILLPPSMKISKIKNEIPGTIGVGPHS